MKISKYHDEKSQLFVHRIDDELNKQRHTIIYEINLDANKLLINFNFF